MDDNKKKALGAALGQIEKQFGKGAVMRLGDSAASRDIDAVSTGSIGLATVGCFSSFCIFVYSIYSL